MSNHLVWPDSMCFKDWMLQMYWILFGSCQRMLATLMMWSCCNLLPLVTFHWSPFIFWKCEIVWVPHNVSDFGFGVANFNISHDKVIFLLSGVVCLFCNEDVGLCVCSAMRTKQYMANRDYNSKMLWYPKVVALQRLPCGLPAGFRFALTLVFRAFPTYFVSFRLRCGIHVLWLWGVAKKRDMSHAFVDNIKKHCPVLRSFGLNRAAIHLEEWIDGSLQLEPPPDVSASLASNHVLKTSISQAVGSRCFQTKGLFCLFGMSLSI